MNGIKNIHVFFTLMKDTRRYYCYRSMFHTYRLHTEYIFFLSVWNIHNQVSNHVSVVPIWQ